MASTKKDVEIKVAEIKLNNIKTLQRTGVRILESRLIYPRPTVAQKATSISLQFDDGAWTSNGKSWTESVLFKESIQGDTGLEITLSDIVSDKTIDEALTSGAAAFVKVMGQLASEAFGERYLGPFADIPASVISKAITGKAQIKIIATAIQDIPSLQIADLRAGDISIIEAPLLAKSAITTTTNRQTRSAGGRSTSKTLAAKGSEIGTVKFQIRAI
jgi:hypothetical protein